MLKRLGWEVWLALAFVSIGLVMVGVAWNGAASQDCVECQIPYILSGGVGGLALIGLGTGLLLFIAGKRMLRRLEAKHDAMIEAVREAAGLQVEATAPANGAAGETADDGHVIVGRSSFHRPDCRLVEGKQDMEAIPAEEAEARGLQPCRVCAPLEVTAPARSRTRA